jgi:hypothetical protein
MAYWLGSVDLIGNVSVFLESPISRPILRRLCDSTDAPSGTCVQASMTSGLKFNPRGLSPSLWLLYSERCN